MQLIERTPTAEEYAGLRRAVGWPELNLDALVTGLRNSLYAVCVLDDDGRLVGCGRVVGDGGIYFYLQDVIVLPDHQRRGHGRRIMDALMGHVARPARENSFIGLMAAAGVAGYYHRYGFVERPADRAGMGQYWKPGIARP